MQEDARPWYALIAGAVGTMEPAGRVMTELVSRRECSEGARFAALQCINELGAEQDYGLIAQLRTLAGESWHPGDVKFVFSRCKDSRAYQNLVREQTGTMDVDQSMPIAAELIFDHGIAAAWDAWIARMRTELPGMPDYMLGQFETAMQRPLRRRVSKTVHNTIADFRTLLKDKGVEGYGEKHQLQFYEVIQRLGDAAWRHFTRAEERAEVLLKSDDEHVAELSAKVEQLRAEQIEITEDEAEPVEE